MPRSRRRHHSRSRSRSRSHSHDKERDPKRRKIETYDSPQQKRSLSSEPENIPDSIYGNGCNNSSIVQPTKEVVKEETGSLALSTIKEIDEETSEKHPSAFSSEASPIPGTDETDRIKKRYNEAVDSEAIGVPETDDDERRAGKPSNEVEEVDDNERVDEKLPTSDNTQNFIETKGDITVEADEKSGTSGKDEDDDSAETTTLDLTLDSDKEENLSGSEKSKNISTKALTPKQLKKKEQADNRRHEKLKEREERLKKKYEEREQMRLEKLKLKQERDEKKNKEKTEKQEQKRREREEREQKRRDKEEKEEQKRKEREQERLKKQQELEEKNKEKQRLEEQKQKAAAAFVNFFVPKKCENDDKKVEENCNSLFKNFEVKSDMRLPPKRRNSLTDEDKNIIINCILKPDNSCSYLNDLKNKQAVGKCGKTWTYEDPLEEVTIIEDDNDLGETICEDKRKSAKLRAKFLKFHENRRPPYFGTWRKKSASIKPRKPLAQDVKIFNYEEDSDDDWEEEEQGESLDDSDGEDKETEGNNDDYEVDNDFFVPHGHLSEDEIDDEATSKLSPESHKQKLKLLKEEFDEAMKSKTNKIKPRFIGCIWYDREAKNVDEQLYRYLKPLSIMTNGFVILKKRGVKAHHKKTDLEITELDSSLIPEFIKLVHGNMNKRTTLISEFLSYMNKNGFDRSVTKASLGRKIKQIAQWMKCPEEGPMHNKFCWFVPVDIRKKYNVLLSLPNQWQLIKN